MQTLLIGIVINGPKPVFHAYPYSLVPPFQQTEPSLCLKYSELSNFCALKILFMLLRTLSPHNFLRKTTDNIQDFP